MIPTTGAAAVSSWAELPVAKQAHFTSSQSFAQSAISAARSSSEIAAHDSIPSDNIPLRVAGERAVLVHGSWSEMALTQTSGMHIEISISIISIVH